MRSSSCTIFLRRWRPLFLLLLAWATLPGCERPQPPLAPTKPPEVLVSLPVIQEVTDYEDFTGRTDATASVDIRARVTGYLDKVHFKEGAEVQKEDLLFEIDPRPYQAEMERAEANVVQSEARLRRLTTDYQRALTLLPRKAISQEEFDKIAGDRAEAEAAIKVAQASREIAKLNLTFTKVTAPIGGRASRSLIDPGNLVKADDTILTTIVNLDPIYAYFDVDENTLLRIRRLILKGTIKSARVVEVAVFLALADEEGFPHKGKINFAENRVDPNTGTLRVRGIFDNPKQLLSPGLFVRIRVPIGLPHKALRVSERALGTDQGQKFLYVVNDKNEVEYRRVKVGPLGDGLRVIEEGLRPEEKIIVSGLQRVRPGVKVEPKLVDMPAPAAPAPLPAQIEAGPAESKGPSPAKSQ